MLNYEVAAELLRPLVPSGTELDTHDGRTYVSLVAFQFLNTRLLGVPIPFHRDFPEVNLRFYVRRSVGAETRRAVVFIREIVPRAAIAAVARMVYNEPYVALPMRGLVEGHPPSVLYAWRMAGSWQTLEASARGEARLPEPGSLEEFITDHAWGYTRQRDGTTIEYRVEHAPWTVWPAHDVKVTGRLEPLFGPELARVLTRPTSSFLAAGSPVTVYRPTRWRTTNTAHTLS
jgi:uncharacterized protein YqjF (DUF2071 family)